MWIFVMYDNISLEAFFLPFQKGTKLEKESGKSKDLNFTPNMITAISAIIGMLAVYYLYERKIEYFTIFFLIYYTLDILDGYYARKYQMCTKMGDYFDHLRDVLVVLPIVLIIIYYEQISIFYYNFSFSNVILMF